MKLVEREEKQGVPPEAIAKVVRRIVEGGAKGPRYSCGAALQRLTVVLKRLLPGRIFEDIIASFYGIRG
jgi:hypothetical protein